MPHSLLKAPPQQAFSLWTCLWGEFFPTGAPPDAEQFRTAAIGTSRAQAVAHAAGGGARRGQRPSAASARRGSPATGLEVEACDGVELLEHIPSSADGYRLAVDGIVGRNWGRPGWA